MHQNDHHDEVHIQGQWRMWPEVTRQRAVELGDSVRNTMNEMGPLRKMSWNTIDRASFLLPYHLFMLSTLCWSQLPVFFTSENIYYLRSLHHALPQSHKTDCKPFLTMEFSSLFLLGFCIYLAEISSLRHRERQVLEIQRLLIRLYMRFMICQ